MKYAFYLGHPAHFHLFKNIINLLKKEHAIIILARKKDVLFDLLDKENIDYYTLSNKIRGSSIISAGLEVLKTDYKMFSFLKSIKPDILLGTCFSVTHVGKILRKPSIVFNEDDEDVVPLFSKITYPFATNIITPSTCEVKKIWKDKHINYSGYHELAYLHPKYFKPDKKIIEKYFSPDKPYFIIRFAKLKAHHDKGIKGININIAKTLINILKPFGKIYITSERGLERELEPYRININPIDMHHILAYAKLFIGDSQTMAAEAGVLGTPFIRYNDFVGKIGYLNELENKYKLGFGFKTNQTQKMLNKVQELLNMPDIKDIFQKRRQKMLADKIDVTAFMVWFIENYPESAEIMKENPDYQERFK